ncbi:formin-like protein 3 isoform X2 [Iris pallida]|uniref:Formin-like protein 3 isoform X2 n=1 Tax=Iris pallida TaxID=29817 RepID=A0AAX6FSY4_IRIPA|nr:formin-like protein 3 isoform X2 [Iris pallida]
MSMSTHFLPFYLHLHFFFPLVSDTPDSN